MNPREKYHRMLDEAMDDTKEGEFFLSHFVSKILQEQSDKIKELEKKVFRPIDLD